MIFFNKNGCEMHLDTVPPPFLLVQKHRCATISLSLPCVCTKVQSTISSICRCSKTSPQHCNLRCGTAKTHQILAVDYVEHTQPVVIDNYNFDNAAKSGMKAGFFAPASNRQPSRMPVSVRATSAQPCSLSEAGDLRVRRGARQS